MEREEGHKTSTQSLAAGEAAAPGVDAFDAQPADSRADPPQARSEITARSGVTARFEALSKTRYAYPALFGGALLESTIFPWPIEIVLAGMMLSDKRHIWPAALIAAAGSVIGATLFFLIGAYLFESAGTWLVTYFGMSDSFEAKRQAFQDHSVLIIFLAAHTPVPFQITALAAGVAGVGLWTFVIAASAARTLRYALMAGTIHLFGPALRRWWRGLPAWGRQAGYALVTIVFVVSLLYALL